MTPTIFQLTVFPGKVRWTATSSLSAIINTFPPVFAVDSRIFTNYKNQVWREYDHQLKFIGIIVVCKKIMILNDSCFYRQRITRKSWGTIFSSCDYRILLVANKRSIYVTCQHILKKFFDHWYISHAVFVQNEWSTSMMAIYFLPLVLTIPGLSVLEYCAFGVVVGKLWWVPKLYR